MRGPAPTPLGSRTSRTRPPGEGMTTTACGRLRCGVGRHPVTFPRRAAPTASRRPSPSTSRPAWSTCRTTSWARRRAWPSS
eukprot:4757328-Alexandrium_andersonii.AAC.1